LVDWRPLARGGFSTVWQAKQESLDRLVAVKVDHRPLSEDRERRRFLREAGAAGRLSGHIGIVTVHDAGILADGRPYLVMDLCPGGSLTQWLKPEGRRSERRIRDVGVRIADALAAAHARGVLHRDVKPANILIDSYDNPGLADFGLAAMPEPGVELSVTLEGMTPAYAPKEVFYLEPPTEFGDVYSLAATLYALLDGKPPRWPDTGTPSLPQLMELQRQPIERLPNVDPAFMDVLLGAMDDDAAHRPTAAQFRDQLAELSFAPSSNTDAKAMQQDATAPAVGSAEDASDASAGGPEAARAGASDAAGGSSAVTGQRRRRPPVAALVLAAVVVAALILFGMLYRGTPTSRADPGTTPASTGAGETTSTSPSAASPTATSKPPSTPAPTVSKPPDGFVDCSKQLGKNYYCVDPASPECWDDPFDYLDRPKTAAMRDCSDFHSAQTFAAGQLPVYIRSQSQFEARKEVKRLCTTKTLNKVLVGRKALKDWQIQDLPVQVQIEGDNLFRCLVGPGQSTRPLKLRVPS
jgi:serine/threonine protein kinase